MLETHLHTHTHTKIEIKTNKQKNHSLLVQVFSWDLLKKKTGGLIPFRLQETSYIHRFFTIKLFFAMLK